MDRTFLLRVVTPDRQVVRDDIEELQIPGKEGYLGILPGHAALISELKIGEISYRRGRELSYLAVNWGFVEVLAEQVTVLAETAERPERAMATRCPSASTKGTNWIRSEKCVAMSFGSAFTGAESNVLLAMEPTG